MLAGGKLLFHIRKGLLCDSRGSGGHALDTEDCLHPPIPRIRISFPLPRSLSCPHGEESGGQCLNFHGREPIKKTAKK